MGEAAQPMGRIGKTKPVSSLVGRKIASEDRSTVIRLEAPYWEALDEIAAREGSTIDQICTDIRNRTKPLGDAAEGSRSDRRPSSGVSLANAVRAFIVGYFRQVATEQGHSRAGHGRGDPFNGTPFAAIAGKG